MSKDPSWITLKSEDLYYICQVIDGVLKDPRPYLRGIEDIFGDAAILALLTPFEKHSHLHIFVEGALDFLMMEGDVNDWIAKLIKSNQIGRECLGRSRPESLDVATDELLEELINAGVYTDLRDSIARQVFYVLFGNRELLKSLGELTSGYILSASDVFPDYFNGRGTLLRRTIPGWAARAVFYRDKGRCAMCGLDCTPTLRPEKNENYDHIVPLAKGGANDVTNLQLLCGPCNRQKSASGAITSGNYLEWY